MTEAEELLWDLLKNKQCHNRKFRRQHPIGSFITDFYCHEEKLVIELDGKHHLTNAETKAYDENRTLFFKKNGLKVIRFENELVKEQPTFVLNQIKNALQ